MVGKDRDPAGQLHPMGGCQPREVLRLDRTLNLNAAYHNIIKPAVQDAGLLCVRADEITHSGVIDKVMYEMLLRADVVVADISTANPNALYELGVGHALCPCTTIIIKEVDGKLRDPLVLE
jgi:hypothetical protein